MRSGRQASLHCLQGTLVPCLPGSPGMPLSPWKQSKKDREREQETRDESSQGSVRSAQGTGDAKASWVRWGTTHLPHLTLTKLTALSMAIYHQWYLSSLLRTAGLTLLKCHSNSAGDKDSLCILLPHPTPWYSAWHRESLSLQ